MACFSNFLEVADDNRVTYTDANWQVRWHCMRGYEPYFTLHKRRRFLGFAWWSGLQKWGDEQPLMEYIKRWNSWPNAKLNGAP